MRKRLIAVLAITIALGAGFMFWQHRRFKKAAETVPAVRAEDLALSALSELVVDPALLDYGNENLPLLEQQVINPGRSKERTLLARTWINAAELAKHLPEREVRLRGVVSSSDFLSIPTDQRNDGWNNPYCVFVKASKWVFISSGGKPQIQCSSLQETARKLDVRTPDARLRRLSSDGFLITIQPGVNK